MRARPYPRAQARSIRWPRSVAAVIIEHRGEDAGGRSDGLHRPYGRAVRRCSGSAQTSRILFGAVVTAEDGQVEIGARCVVMENAVLRRAGQERAHARRRRARRPARAPERHDRRGRRVPATGVALFPARGSARGRRCGIHGVVHVNSTVAPGAVVPIGWVSVGDEVHPPCDHDAIWAVQEGLDFPGTVYGLPRDAPARERMERQSAWFAAHRDDRMM